MPTFYNFTENGLVYSFDDVFVPADLFREGNLWTWGSAGYVGKLGNNSIATALTPVTTFSGGSNWKQVSCAIRHTAAIKTDGTLWIWGEGFMLGNAQTTNRSTPVTTFAGGTNWKQVSCINQHTAAIKTDGTLWTWGYRGSGRLGNGVITGTTSTPVTTFAGGTNWKQVSAGSQHTAAIKTDGTLWTWGSGGNGQLGNGNASTVGNISTPVTTFAGGTNWKQVSAGGLNTAAIKTDGTLWIWGTGSRLGNGVTTGSIGTPVTTFAGGNNWKQVSIGNQHTAAIKTDGTLWTWGNGNNGKLGNGSTSNTNIITPITTFAGGNNWKQVSAGYNHTAAIKTDGTLWTWGKGTDGQLGITLTANRSTPVFVSSVGTNWKQVSSGDSHTAVTTYDDPVI
jgi:alpha-tubulin suppressor-like RCC1 family protein